MCYSAGFGLASAREALLLLLGNGNSFSVLLRIFGLRHGVVTSEIALTARAFWTRDAEAPASSDASASCYRRSEDVGVLAVVMAELKLGEIQRQILLAYVVECPNYATLQERPERFDVVGVDLATHVLASRVRYGAVLVPQRFQIVISVMLVSRDQINL